MTAYARIHRKADEPGVYRIGRVVSERRGEGLGRSVLEAAIAEARRLGAAGLYIEAQVYAVGFYEKVGFRVTGAEFLEDGIPHVEMRREL